MIPAILLAADLLDHATDIRFGDATNEMAAWRFEQATTEDGAVRSDLLRPALLDDRDDVDAMTFGSWVWLLGWRQRQGVRLDEELLYALGRSASSADRRLRLRVVVGRDRALNAEVGSIDEYQVDSAERQLPSDWLSDQVLNAATRHADPFELTRHLLQVGTDLTLAALAMLLSTQGADQDELRREVRRQFTAGLEDEQSRRWLNRLGLG